MGKKEESPISVAAEAIQTIRESTRWLTAAHRVEALEAVVADVKVMLEAAESQLRKQDEILE